jgi:diphthamide synthase subunit DPH2
MRRYAVVQKARDADVFGILVGTLGVGSPPTCFFGYRLSS